MKERERWSEGGERERDKITYRSKKKKNRGREKFRRL
jgi:hypothetical protein